jgi:hypothetical protein
MRVPLIFPSVLATSTAVCIDAMPSIPEAVSQAPEQAVRDHLSNARPTLYLRPI